MKLRLNLGLLVLILLFSGCQMPKQMEQKPEVKLLVDKAPTGPIPTFFKAIIPKSEALSRYGNPSSYRVYGKTYRVMPSSKGYHERGVASWYASKFHHQRTSSGEPFDMYALTAAHRNLPLPTYLKVKNLQNGREIIVKVNDRGPFHAGRILDLSYGAAVKLGMFPRGTAKVEITALPNQAQGQARKRQYFIQLAAFSSRPLAYQLKNKLARLGRHDVAIQYINHKYIVRCGPMKTPSELSQRQRWLVAHHLPRGFSVII